MVHMILLHGGQEQELIVAEKSIREIGDGWIHPEPRVWIVASDLDAKQWRDHIGATGVDLFVAELSGSWASKGMPEVTDWTKKARKAF